jgi:hypothetical protein
MYAMEAEKESGRVGSRERERVQPTVSDIVTAQIEMTVT